MEISFDDGHDAGGSDQRGSPLVRMQSIHASNKMREARSQHASQQELRKRHSAAHLRRIRELEGRGRSDDLPHYLALQQALSAQAQAREAAFQQMRRNDRQRRLQSRETMAKASPVGTQERITDILTNTRTSTLARLLAQYRGQDAQWDQSGADPRPPAQEGHSDDFVDDDDDESVDTVPDPGWDAQPIAPDP